MRCYRISYKDCVTDEEVRATVQQAVGPHVDRNIPSDANCSGMDMSLSVHQVWPKPSCKAQWKREEVKADRGRGGKTTSGNGQAWSSASPRGQWRTGKNGKHLVAQSPMVPQWPSQSRDIWWWWISPAMNCISLLYVLTIAFASVWDCVLENKQLL